MPNGFISRRLPGGNGGGRAGRLARQAAVDALSRATILEEGDDRRAHVYRTDVVFTGTESSARLPGQGPELTALVEKVTVMRAAGVSQLKIAEGLGIDVSQVRYLCSRYKIPKGEK